MSPVLSAIARAASSVVFAALLASRARAAGESPLKIIVASDDVRPRRGDADVQGMLLPAAGAEVRLEALRGETVAFQVVLIAGQQSIGTAAVSFSAMVGGTTTPSVRVFRQHYLRVDRRSHNDRRPNESLGWRPGARPPDSDVIGDIPDALIPVEIDARAVAPLPMVPAGQLGGFWVDVEVPDEAVPGPYRSEAEVVIDGARVARFAVTVAVHGAQLPYRAASVFMFYEPQRLDKRIGDGGAVERDLWQLLHRHHVDALAPLGSGEDVQRLGAVYDGSLFSAAAGYRGPGAGLPPAVVALGAYGTLGDPTPEAVKRVGQMVDKLSGAIGDIFLYAVDEQCESPRAAAWKAALADMRRVWIGQTCGQAPDRQAADVVMIPAGDFARRHVAAARALGRRAWIYNGLLPHTGTMLLDADPRGLTANGWIAALGGIERWFYWEATFWDDDNRGGRGPVDPFATAENFHNRDGDSALGDGLLLYPGRQQGAFAARAMAMARSAGYPGVFSSVRLKAIRRGIEDAGYLALAARERPDETYRLAAKLLPAILDEAGAAQPASWSSAAHDFSRARAELRGLITQSDPASAEDVRRALGDLATRRLGIPPAGKPTSRGMRVVFLAAALLVVVVGALVLWWSRRRRPPASGRTGEIGR